MKTVKESIKEPQNPSVELIKMYVKDISMQVPQGPAAFQLEWKPELQFEIHTSAKSVKEAHHFEVFVHLKCTNRCAGQVAFTIEVAQAGLFKIDGLDEEALKHTLGTFCPNMLYPFVRETVGDLVMRSGFPQLNLAAVNFEQIYQKSLEEKVTIQ